MSDVQGGDLSARRIISKLSILAKLLLAKKRPRLGLQLPNAGDDNQSCHILTVIVNRVDRLRVP